MQFIFPQGFDISVENLEMWYLEDYENVVSVWRNKPPFVQHMLHTLFVTRESECHSSLYRYLHEK